MIFNLRTSTVLAAVLLAFSSCVNKEYEISEDKLNLEVEVFQEGVCLPLGSTAPIKVKSLLEQYGEDINEYLSVGNNGAYAFAMKDVMDFTDALDALPKEFGISAYTINESFPLPFELSDIDLSSVKVDAQSVYYEKNLSQIVGSLDIEIPEIRPEPFNKTTDISRYVPDTKELSLDLGSYNQTVDFVKLGHVNIPDYLINDTEIALDGGPYASLINFTPEFDLSENPVSFDMDITLPKDIEAVDKITLNKNAKVKISMEIDNHFFTDGELLPEVEIDLDLLENPIDVKLRLDKSNGYFAVTEQPISNLAISSSDWTKAADGTLVLDKEYNLIVKGQIGHNGLKTTTRALSQFGNEPVQLKVSVEFVDLVIEDVAMRVSSFETPVETSFPVNISQDLPEMITSIDEITFTDDSGIWVEISVDNVDRITGLQLEVASLELEFPSEIQMEGASAGKLSIPVGVLKDGTITKHIKVSGMTPQVKNGQIVFDGDISVSAVAKVYVKEGEYLHSSTLPVKDSDNISLGVKAVGKFDLADYKVGFGGYEYKLEDDVLHQEISSEVPAELADFCPLTVRPVGDPVISIDLTLPEIGLDLLASEGGLSVKFPEMLVFKNTPAEYDSATHTLRYTGRIPEKIQMVVDYIVINPVKNDADGKWYVGGEFDVNGGIALSSGIVTKKDVDVLTSADSKVVFEASIPEITPESVDISSYQASIEQEFTFGDIDLSSIPDELESISLIELDDVELNLNVKAAGLRDVIGNAAVNVHLEAALPEIILLENSLDSDNILSINGVLNENDEIVFEPVGIRGLDLSSVDLKAEDPLGDLKIAFDGTLTVDDASLDFDALQNTDLNLMVNGSLCSKGTEAINVSKVIGRIDYQIPSVSQTLDLSEIVASMTEAGLDANLELNRYNLELALETNLCIPLEAKLEVQPYKNGNVMTEYVFEQELQLNLPESAAQTAWTKLWISNTDKDCPSTSEYQFVALDLFSIISEMPDSVHLGVNAGVRPDVDCVFEPGADYVLNADYSLEVPMEFGDDFKIEFSRDIEDLPEELAMILSYGSFGLTGEITSSLPLELELTYDFIDSNGNVVDMLEEAGHQLINSCDENGAPVTTPLNIVVGVKKNANVESINALRLNFRVSSGQVPGVPITEETFIQASLQALVPEGIRLDLGQMMEEEN